MCLYPRLIKNRKYIANKKNGGVIPAINDIRVTMVPVGCGKCMECVKQKGRQWQVRLAEEVRSDNKGIFVTLTFSDESIKELSSGIRIDGYERDNEIATLGVRRFLERWRKKHKKSVKHWLVTELGHEGTENIHMHGIIWTDKRQDIEDIWKYGYVFMGEYIGQDTVNYITKYITKVDNEHREYKPKILTSSGIGKGYIKKINVNRNKYVEGGTRETYKNSKGYEMGLPIYYRNKIYSDEEKEKLWIEKLDKQERWVGGSKIDISENEELYYKAVEYQRKINKRLGYGDDKIDWEKKRYENERRNLQYEKRIKRTEKVRIEPEDIESKEVIKGGSVDNAW